MTRYIHLKIYKDLFVVFLNYNKTLPNLSRKYKYLLGQEIQKLFLNCFKLIIKVNSIKEQKIKIKLIEDLILELEQLIILFRTLSFLKEISQKYYLNISTQILEILKQAQGWKKNYFNLFSRGDK